MPCVPFGSRTGGAGRDPAQGRALLVRTISSAIGCYIHERSYLKIRKLIKKKKSIGNKTREILSEVY